MSALQIRSANTSMPAAESAKTSTPGEENATAVQAQEHKKVTEQKQSENDGPVHEQTTLYQPFGLDHEPSKPEALVVQAEADQ
ncbi:hypothetical protein B0A48_13351 [Cryoendolithus antarcticus]|uniref:Uncharacterized protein n=1 Tax=Cryoendolithus antarcticus TaxID=1507870 RepID=A0A1V8SQ02_9PEZI|nr:hypothetical protein B0A48_13351 [Cryoendolithus antarcticus]